MMIPSIDIQNGRAVQLVNGKTFALDGGDPFTVAENFSLYGELAVIDLDAAMGKGDNEDLILQLVRRFPCRVGGGIRSIDKAVRLLDGGALRVIVGTMASPEFLSQLPRSRLVAALDTYKDELRTEGWQAAGSGTLEERLRLLAPYVSGFLCTQIEREGLLGGLDIERAMEIKGLLSAEGFAGDLVVAGGVKSAEEVASLDAAGIDAQVGMALYTGSLTAAQALAACLRSDRPDGLWPTVVCDEAGRALGLVYSSRESLLAACEQRKGIYYSRTRGLWEKGGQSGNTQRLLAVAADCDRDALRFIVRQCGGFCHRGTSDCFAQSEGGRYGGLDALEKTVAGRLSDVEAGHCESGSYTARLFREGGLLAAKLREEADELAEATTPERVAEEAADLAYFMCVKLAAAGVRLAEVEAVLDRRARKLLRRPGNAKQPYRAKGNEPWQTGLH